LVSASACERAREREEGGGASALARLDTVRRGRSSFRERGEENGTHLDGDDASTLLGDTLRAALASGLVADAASLGLVGEDLGAVRLGLGLVDVVHENALRGRASDVSTAWSTRRGDEEREETHLVLHVGSPTRTRSRVSKPSCTLEKHLGKPRRTLKTLPCEREVGQHERTRVAKRRSSRRTLAFM